MNENEEEDFAMLVRKVGKLFYKKGRMSNYQKGRPQGRDDRKKEEMGLCYNVRRRDT